MAWNSKGRDCVYFIVRDEYKEFEKLIQEDLQEVDDRLEEEEVIPNLYPFLCK